MQDIYKIKTSPLALSENVVQGEKYRITMLTEGLVRLEYSEDGVFEDRATQMVLYRDFPETSYRLVRTEDGIEIHTSRIHLIYNEKEFSANGLSIQVKGNLSVYHSLWRYGEEIHDLGGTARTLDEANGAIKLDHGIVSQRGFSVIDDSKSQTLLEDGWIEPRKAGVKDLYFFGYGHDYKKALEDFYYLCGTTPMIPRYALGNWWSRYYKYTEESYMELMERFDKENLPFTVAVIDMDWHLVDIDPKYGSGWTGYTWNKEFFPDPKRFLKKLHDRGMHTTLNVHPADGIRAHEEMYVDMAKAMGVDYEHEDPVNCDPADPKFLEAYFEYVHHPREEEGVDFWWIDWQQGSSSKIPGLDPLWILNHFHFLDSKRNGKRPMTFSRYAGPGSHRYPLGFSGDTIVTWESLDFQPYFTSTASNIGYGWWSHDIGGHMMGYKDDEMEGRWAQLGIYSPIMRLHSSCSEFNGKEPWRFKKEVADVMGDALRERHRMIPYLYSMNYRSYHHKLPMILPMYYEYPEERHAYEVKNQYWFGSQLMVAPITSKRIQGLNVASVDAWLPEGLWYDIHTGMIYDGGRMLKLYRSLEEIPVLAKAGAVVPFTDEISAVQAVANPTSLHIGVYAGADGNFELYEDDNETCDYENGVCVKTAMNYKEDEKAVFTIEAARGQLSLIPEKRSYTIEMTGYRKQAAKDVAVLVDGVTVYAGDSAVVGDSAVTGENTVAGDSAADGQTMVSVSYDSKKQAVVVNLGQTPVTSQVQIIMNRDMQSMKNDVKERIFQFLNQAEIGFFLKDKVYDLVLAEKRVGVLLAELSAMELDADLYGVLSEILTAGRDSA